MTEFRLNPKDRVVIIGDSNTDTEYRGRCQPLGYGYVMMFDAFIAAKYPNLDLAMMNRGNNGDTVLDLARRWEEDVIANEPDWLFINIGTNDVGRRFVEDKSQEQVDDETFEATLRELVGMTAQHTRVVLVEPPCFELPADAPAHVDLGRICGIIRRIANHTGSEHVPVFDGMLKAMERGAYYWFQNVNHPHLRGHAYTAQQLLRHIGWSL